MNELRWVGWTQRSTYLFWFGRGYQLIYASHPKMCEALVRNVQKTTTLIQSQQNYSFSTCILTVNIWKKLLLYRFQRCFVAECPYAFKWCRNFCFQGLQPGLQRQVRGHVSPKMITIGDNTLKGEDANGSIIFHHAHVRVFCRVCKTLQEILPPPRLL